MAVQETGLFLPDEPIEGLGPQPELAAKVFAMKEGEVSPAMRVATGWVFAAMVGKQDPYVPKLDEVATKVRDDLTREKAAELAKARAAAIATDLKAAKDFAVAAKKAGLEVKTTELVARGTALPEVGINDAVDQVAFSLPAGGVSDAIATPTGTAIIRVVERHESTPEEIAAGRDLLRDELVNQRRDKFFGAYMQKAKAGPEDQHQAGHPRARRRKLAAKLQAELPDEHVRHMGQHLARPEQAARREHRGERPALAGTEQHHQRVGGLRGLDAAGGRLKLVAQDLEDAPPRRVDQQPHFLTRRNMGALLREADRRVEAAELVDEAVVLRLPAGPHASLRDLVDLLGRHVPGLGRALDELVVDRLHRRLHLRALLRA